MRNRHSVPAVLAVTCIAAVFVGAATPAGARQSRPTPVAHAAVATVGATWLLSKLGEGAVKGAGSQAFGWLLAGFGLGSGSTVQLNAILDKLTAIENHLDKIDLATQELRQEVSHGTYSTLAAHAAKITSQVEYGFRELTFIGQLKDAASRARLTNSLLDYIHAHLMGSTQLELDKYVSGSHGTDGLIVAASKSAKAHTRYWTAQTSKHVYDVSDYYQTIQAQLLVLRTEYWHARTHPHDYAYVERHITDAKQILHDQQKLLKPAPPAETVADTHSDLDWLWSLIFVQGTYPMFNSEIYATTIGTLTPVYEYRLPTLAELEGFLDKRPHRKNWVEWLRDTQHVPLPDPLYPVHGVYARNLNDLYGPQGFGPRTTWVLRADGAVLGYNENLTSSAGFGAFGVRTRSHAYWW